MYYSRLNLPFCGLTNQIFMLVNSIIKAYENGEKVVVLDYFLNDISKKNYTQCSDIFDIPKINNYLFSKYNVLIFDKYDAKFELLNVKYGTNEIKIDITQHIKEKFFNNNVLYINKNTELNELAGDPVYNEPKKLFVYYKIQNYEIEEIYDEYLENDICFDILNATYNLNHLCVNKNNEMFNDILTNIHYNSYYLEKSQKIFDHIFEDIDLTLQNKINVVHLRIEDDAIDHWSQVNKMNKLEFKNILEHKYISYIEKFIDKDEQTIILSGNSTNNVIQFLTENNYNYLLPTKIFNEREKNAIIDLLISKYCNNIFIGNYNFINKSGSTFSYYVSKIINNDNNNIFIDLDDINSDYF